MNHAALPPDIDTPPDGEVDVSLIDALLELSVLERLRRNDDALELSLMLRRAGEKHHGLTFDTPAEPPRPAR